MRLLLAACVCSAPYTRGPSTGVAVLLITHHVLLSGGREGPEAKPSYVPAARFHLFLLAHHLSSFS